MPILDYTVRELLEKAAKIIVRESEIGPEFDRRIDRYFELVINDPKIGTKHPVVVRLKITARSLLFERTLDGKERQTTSP